jgi:hypothetical protein
VSKRPSFGNECSALVLIPASCMCDRRVLVIVCVIVDVLVRQAPQNPSLFRSLKGTETRVSDGEIPHGWKGRGGMKLLNRFTCQTGFWAFQQHAEQKIELFQFDSSLPDSRSRQKPNRFGFFASPTKLVFCFTKIVCIST